MRTAAWRRGNAGGQPGKGQSFFSADGQGYFLESGVAKPLRQG